MSRFTNKDLEESIKKSLGITEDNVVKEAYVAQAKQFDLSTELLSDGNKKNHIELYDQYVEDFNRISAELDTADRDNVNQ